MITIVFIIIISPVMGCKPQADEQRGSRSLRIQLAHHAVPGRFLRLYLLSDPVGEELGLLRKGRKRKLQGRSRRKWVKVPSSWGRNLREAVGEALVLEVGYGKGTRLQGSSPWG